MKLRLFHVVVIVIATLTPLPPAFAQSNVTAVAYHNQALVPGFNLISNPLFNAGSHLSNVVSGLQNPIPDRLTFFFLEGNLFHSATYDAIDGTWLPPSAGGQSVHPGRGFFVFNPTTNNLTITFAGTILQGSLTNSLPAGFSLVASMVPQPGTLTTLAFPTEQGDVAFFWDELNQRFQPSTYDDIDGAWLPPLRPLRVGEAFLVFKVNPALWIREFNVNEP